MKTALLLVVSLEPLVLWWCGQYRLFRHEWLPVVLTVGLMAVGSAWCSRLAPGLLPPLHLTVLIMTFGLFDGILTFMLLWGCLALWQGAIRRLMSVGRGGTEEVLQPGYVLVAVVLAPVEELIYRGVVLHVLRDEGVTMVWAVLLTALIFGLHHLMLGADQVVVHVLSGLAFGFAAIQGGLGAAASAHVGFNLLAGGLPFLRKRLDFRMKRGWRDVGGDHGARSE